jgi:hypothetical protein
VAANQRPILDFNVVASSSALEKQVVIAGSNERAPANYCVVQLGFFDSDVAESVEAIGEGA